MKYNHELIVPDEGLPFKMFIFEGKDGNYKRDALASFCGDFCGL